jgi:hypothetical protein
VVTWPVQSKPLAALWTRILQIKSQFWKNFACMLLVAASPTFALAFVLAYSVNKMIKYLRPQSIFVLLLWRPCLARNGRSFLGQAFLIELCCLVSEIFDLVFSHRIWNMRELLCISCPFSSGRETNLVQIFSKTICFHHTSLSLRLRQGPIRVKGSSHRRMKYWVL